MSFPYQNFLSSTNFSLGEGKETFFLSEKILQILWLEQKHLKELKTDSGESIEVLSPGFWNHESGPDFLKGSFRIRDQEFKGDVELHLHEADWSHHRHGDDERYGNVILHVVFWESASPKRYKNSAGKEMFTLFLQPFLKISIKRLIGLIDVDLYPYKKFLGSGKCAEKLFKDLSKDAAAKLFAAAAEWRLEQKSLFLASQGEDLTMQILAGIAMGLGYKNNSRVFLDLFLSLIPFRDQPALLLLSRALGTTGFLQEGRMASWEESSFYQELRKLWLGQQGAVEEQFQLKVDHVRPLNHPVRRMVYLINMIQDPRLINLEDVLAETWSDWFLERVFSSKSWRQLTAKLLEILPSYQEEYWNCHYTFENFSRLEFIPLMGNGLKKEIVLNTFFPLLYKMVKNKGVKDELDEFKRFYASLKGEETGKKKYLTHRFFGQTKKGELLDQAKNQQGAYQIHKDFCVHFEASCQGCPFVERYLRTASFQGCLVS